MNQLSLVIPTINDTACLYLTVFAAVAQLVKSDLEWEIIVVADGGTSTKLEKIHPNIRCWRGRFGSPQASRHEGIKLARYKNVCCIDSHVIVSDFAGWVAHHEKYGGALSFVPLCGQGEEMLWRYGSHTDWDCQTNYPWWSRQRAVKPLSLDPYRVVAEGNANVMIDRDWYMKTGGYLTDGVMELQGYGGEEPYIALKAWMTGRECWMFPQFWCAHYSTNRAVQRGGDDWEQHYRNFMICTYVFGGEKYLNMMQNKRQRRLVLNPHIQRERAVMVAGPFEGDIDKLRAYLDREGILN